MAETFTPGPWEMWTSNEFPPQPGDEPEWPEDETQTEDRSTPARDESGSAQ